MSVNAASMIFAVASWILYRQWTAANRQSTYRQQLLANILVTISLLPPTIKRSQNVYSICRGLVTYATMKCIALFVNLVLCGQSIQYVVGYNILNLHAMFHWSDLFACSSRVNIYESAFCNTITLILSAVAQVLITRIFYSYHHVRFNIFK